MHKDSCRWRTRVVDVAHHKVVDALFEKLGEWTSWVPREGRCEPDFDRAIAGLAPARRVHWGHLPLPKARTTLKVDILLDRNEAECLRLGFIPRMMERVFPAELPDFGNTAR